MAIKLNIGDIFKNMVGYFWSKDEGWNEDESPIKYVVAKNGLYEIRETEILKAIAKPTEVKGMSINLQEGITMKTPKIPYMMYYKALNFLRAVHDRDKTEATIHFFWNRETKEYFLWVPKQVNGSASSEYERDKDEEFTAMCQKHVWVMTTHSHPTFSGSFSGIDDKDEKDTRLFMVVGHINKEQQDIAIRTAVNGKHVVLNFYDVFTNPIDESESAPEEWLDRCSKRSAVTKYGNYSQQKTYGKGSYSDGSYYGSLYGDYDDKYSDMDAAYTGNYYKGGYYYSGVDDIDDTYYNSLTKNEYGEDIISEDPKLVNKIGLAELHYNSKLKEAASKLKSSSSKTLKKGKVKK